MEFLVAAAVFVSLVLRVHYATGAVEWCYHLPTCNDATWTNIAPQYCNGTRQSPINIVTADVQPDANLTEFTFVNFDNKNSLQNISNTGRTVKVTLESGLKVSGGGLSEAYDSVQFHLHWGNGSSIPGSEHTVDGKRYPMEFHIVNAKSSLNFNLTEVFADPTGAAALGFFIEEMSGNETGQPEGWKKLTNYLSRITNKGDSVPITTEISLDDLLVGVNRTQYYRYLGSLTTPTCNEVVVWTVFKESVKVSKDLIDLFSSTVHVANSSSPFMIDVYRNIQPAQTVTSQPASSSSGLISTACFTVGLMALSLRLGASY